MQYTDIKKELDIKMATKGYGGLQSYEIKIALLYLSLVKSNGELLDYAKQIVKDSRIDSSFKKRFQNEVERLDDREIRKLIILINKSFQESGFIDAGSELISNLVLKLLELKNGDIIFNYWCTTGSFLANAFDYCEEKNIEVNSFYGEDLNVNSVRICKMIFDILHMNGNVFEGDGLNSDLPNYTKGMVFPPLGRFWSGNVKNKSVLFPEFSFGNNNYGWVYVDRFLANLKDNHKAIAILPVAALFSKQFDTYRKKLLKEGLIEGIIELPSGVMNFTGVQLAVVIFSTGNKKAKLIKVEDNYNNKKSKQVSKRIDIDKIVDDYKNDKSDTFTIKELLTRNSLSYAAAVNRIENIKNGKPLYEVADVYSGAQYTISKFKDSISVEPTERQIVTSGDIEDGAVDWSALPYIEGFEHFDKYQIHKGDLIVTSKSSKVKIAYVEIEPTNKIIVTGGMLIIRPNKNLDGMFLKIFLESEDGMKSLKAVQKGSVITSMNAKDLASIYVPVPPIRAQREIARKYNNKLSTLIALREEMKKIENQLQDFYKKEVN